MQMSTSEIKLENDIEKYSIELLQIINREASGCKRHSTLAAIILHLSRNSDMCTLEKIGTLRMAENEILADRDMILSESKRTDYIG